MSWLEKRPFFRRRLERREMLGLPNYLTYGRIAVIPIIVGLMMTINDNDGRFNNWDYLASAMATVLFVIAALSDVVDGYYARKYNFCSSFGKFIDPLADKLLSTAVLILLIPLHRIAGWVVVILLSREITITTLRAIAADEGIVIAASQWGKYKTIMQNFALGFLIFHYPALGIKPWLIGNWLLFFAILLSVGSGLHYGLSFFREALMRKGISS
ncbi:MAG: CDP-diacylglycerol--glycerol-3-phosphate 3-phosphatidyltransferase [Deltaproteobacteria bacterium]|nr:CDP-diacylglycerol--glycerol-3-phosphate 3-phosphatidyltransferase [Deltaproteobacteria bacterium]